MSILRRVLLSASTNAWLRDRATKRPFVVRSVSRFMPGEQLEDALAAAVRLQSAGIGAILTHLGENLTSAADAEEVTRHYSTRARPDPPRISMPSLGEATTGLDLDVAFCIANLQRLIDRAAGYGNFIWIDMESASYVDATLALFARLGSDRRSSAWRCSVSVSTERDLAGLLPLGAALRLGQGAYLESLAGLRFKKRDVDANSTGWRADSGRARAAGSLCHIATHDATLIDRLATTSKPATSRRRPRVRDAVWHPGTAAAPAGGGGPRPRADFLRRALVSGMRRLAERPANILFMIKNLMPGSGRAGRAPYAPHPP
jgi:proline dehydrogenase